MESKSMPKRTNEHRVETESTNILRDLIVNEAIFRELTEKDYGIDGAIEFFNSDGRMNGGDILVQIKGSRNIIAKKGFVKTPSIKTETVKYWGQKKQSVFILLIDVSNRIIYFEDAKRLAMLYTKKINNQKTISFSIRETQTISTKDLGFFRKEIFIADKLEQSTVELAKLIFNFKEIYKKLIVNAGRDCFMVIDHDDPRIDMLNDISRTLQLCWYFFGVHAHINNFTHFMRLSYKDWNHEYVEMHITETADHLKEQFQFLLIAVIATKEINENFWEKNDKKVTNRLNNRNDFELIKTIAKGNIGINNVNLLNEYVG